MCLHANLKAYVTCNSKCGVETERLLKVTCSLYTVEVVISCKRCNMEKWYCRPLTRSDVQYGLTKRVISDDLE